MLFGKNGGRMVRSDVLGFGVKVRTVEWSV